MLNSMEPQIARIPSSIKRKEIIQDLKDTGKYDEAFLRNHNEMMKSNKRAVFMAVVRQAGQEFIKQINLDEETAFKKEGASDRSEGARVKKAIHGLKAVSDLKAIYDESEDSVKEVRMDRFYKKYIATNAPYKDGANIIFGEAKVKSLNQKWDSILDKKAFLNKLYSDTDKGKIGDLFGDLFDFKCEIHERKSKADNLLYKVTAKHIVTMFRAFDELQYLDTTTKQQIIDEFLQQKILQKQGWSNYTKRERGRESSMSLETLKEGVGKYLNFEENRIFSEPEIMAKERSSKVKQKRERQEGEGR